MAAVRLPVLVWTDRERLVTAVAVDGPERAAATGGSADQAIDALAPFLQKLYEDDDPEYYRLVEPDVLPLRVDLRGEYAVHGRIFSSPERSCRALSKPSSMPFLI